MHLSHSDADTFEIAERLVAEHSHRIILLYGVLGAGKTTFVRGIAKALGIEGPVISPTFQIVCEYRNRDAELIHVDFYRLKRCEEVSLIDMSQWLEHRAKRVVCVEWPERCPDIFLTHRRTEVRIDVDTETMLRTIRYEHTGP